MRGMGLVRPVCCNLTQNTARILLFHRIEVYFICKSQAVFANTSAGKLLQVDLGGAQNSPAFSLLHEDHSAQIS